MKCVVIGASVIENYSELKERVTESDFVIACDGGLYHCEKAGIKPSLIVGDFDSHEKPKTDIETIVLPCEKDDTDTVYAVKEGLSRGYREFVLFGVTGKRLDHTLGNLSVLFMLKEAGATGVIVDGLCEIEAVGREPVKVEKEYSFFSLVNITGTADGVEIRNAKYPLSDASITPFYQYGISNEPYSDCTVSVRNGYLLLIKVK